VFIEALLDLLIPSRCAACGARGAPCCARCGGVWGALREVTRVPTAGLVRVFSLARYSGAGRRLLIAYKERGRRDLAPALGSALAEALAVVPLGGVPLVVAPLGAVPPPGAVPLSGVPLGGVPLGGVPLGGVPPLGVAPLQEDGAGTVSAAGPQPAAQSAGAVSVTPRAVQVQARAPFAHPSEPVRAAEAASHLPSSLPLNAGAPRRLCLVPAPSRPSASRVRGGPHVERLAAAAAKVLSARGFEVAVAPALELASSARDAVGLGPAQRAANLAGRLRFREAGRPPPGFPVVVLDDVVTTGATAAACVRTLAAEGIAVSAVLTLLAAG
jgi:predicted amidophosphoribosyltransferase